MWKLMVMTISRFGTELHVLNPRSCDLGPLLQEVVVGEGSTPFPPYAIELASCIHRADVGF